MKKKLLLLLLALFAALPQLKAMDYYLVGDGNLSNVNPGYNEWTTNSPTFKLNPTSNPDVYELQLNGTIPSGTAFKICDGTWNNSWGTAGNVSNNQVYFSYKNGDNCKTSGSITNPRIRFNSATNAIILGSPTETTIYYDNSATKWSNLYIYYWGTPSNTWAGHKMTKVDDTYWTYTFYGDISKISGVIFNANSSGDNNQTNDYYGSITNNHVYKGAGGNKGAVSDLGEYKGNTPTPITYVYGIHTDIFGDTGWATYDFTESNGVWTLTKETTTTGKFGVKKMKSNDKESYDWYSAPQSGVTAVTETGKAYSLTISNPKDFEFNLAPGNYTFTLDPEAMTLTVTGNATVTPPVRPTLTVIDPVDDGNIYFNAGADYYQWGSLKTLYVYFLNSAVYNSNAQISGPHEMKLLSSGVDSPIFVLENWKSKVPNGFDVKAISFQNMAAFNDRTPSQGDGRVYHAMQRAWGTDRGDNNKFTQPGYDEGDNYVIGKYIYGPANNDLAAVSNMAFNQYKWFRENKGKNGVYFIGNTNFRVDGYNASDWNTKSLMWDQRDNDGLYVTKMIVNKGAEFKVSYVDPNLVKAEVPEWGDNENKANRWWATFNLGIIGPQNEAWFKTTSNGDVQHVTDITREGSPNRKVDYLVGTTMMYNHYNQYDWVVKEINPDKTSNANEYIRGKDLSGSTTLYMVIDTKQNEAGQMGNAALVPFDPRPSLTATKDGELTRKTLANGFTNDNHPGGYNSDEVTDTPVNYTLANELAATVTLNPAENSEGKVDNFDIHYLLYNRVGGTADDAYDENNYDKLGTFSNINKNEAKTLKSLPVGNNSLALMAVYNDQMNFSTQNATKTLAFRSRMSNTDLSVEMPKLTPLTVEGTDEISGTYTPSYAKVHNYKTAEGMYDAIMRIHYNFPKDHVYSTEPGADKEGAAVYPAFKVTVDGNPDAQGYIVHSAYPFLQVASVYEALYGHAKWQVPSSASDTPNDWCAASAEATHEGNDYAQNQEGYLPIYIPSIAKVEGFKGVTVKLTLYACYPFSVYNSDFETNGAQGKSARKLIRQLEAEGELVANPDGVYTVMMPSNYTIELTAEGNTSGIEDVMVAEGEGELYNLQGVRVLDAAPAAGVYIRRNADGTASKVVIR